MTTNKQGKMELLSLWMMNGWVSYLLPDLASQHLGLCSSHILPVKCVGCWCYTFTSSKQAIMTPPSIPWNGMSSGSMLHLYNVGVKLLLSLNPKQHDWGKDVKSAPHLVSKIILQSSLCFLLSSLWTSPSPLFPSPSSSHTNKNKLQDTPRWHDDKVTRW